MPRDRFTDFLSKDELAQLTRTSNAWGWWTLAVNWALIAGAFALAIAWPNPLTIVLAVLVIAGRQLGLGIIVHDCAHHALFSGRRLNETVGQWLAAVPMMSSLPKYRSYHLKHHRFAGTPNDPDIGFVQSYPVARESLRRKFARDLTGRTGFRDQLLAFRRFRFAEQWPWLVFQAGLFAILALAGGWWAYALWWVALLFVYPAIVRLRQIGEHGVATDRSDTDARLNTSTTLVRWWERLFVAPNNVSYHLEHHLAAGVPPYRLREMHRLLKSRGFYEGYACIATGYGDVLRRSVKAAHQPA
ncbi:MULTISPECIES: fatty acid desaturase family protein [unclassified Sphingomonas]|uniref:fatty acid desaturase family protein n=1 Tax=unclassified Sphingomonas TaxID=196159 RepID=UPI00092B945F|nr:MULTISPECIES: fatty acid desaturase family protein [unclassified Sphingomonas]OJU17946.1 MAG: fatty acid desaturase [Sphingomonas sp. 66-10]